MQKNEENSGLFFSIDGNDKISERELRKNIIGLSDGTLQEGNLNDIAVCAIERHFDPVADLNQVVGADL